MAHIHELYDFTASAFILHPKEPKILLLFHNKLQKWLQPGGHIELDENPWQALEREVLEETGLKPEDYTLLLQPEHPTPTGNNTALPIPFYISEHPFAPKPGHKHIDSSFALQASTSLVTDTPDGASKIGWFTLDDITVFLKEDAIFIDTYQICDWLLHKVKKL